MAYEIIPEYNWLVFHPPKNATFITQVNWSLLNPSQVGAKVNAVLEEVHQGTKLGLCARCKAITNAIIVLFKLNCAGLSSISR